MYGCRETCLQLQCRHCKFRNIICVLFVCGLFLCKCFVGEVFETDILLFFVQETNPIFLFNKEMIWSDRDPTIPKITFSIESEIKVKVEESLMMPAVLHTVASRTQLALVLSFLSFLN